MDKLIPVVNPKASYLSCQQEIDEAIKNVLFSGVYILGQHVTNFEKEFADFLNVPYCITVGSGTDALSLALISVGIKAGDEVITVSHTAVATIAAIENIGAKPVFVDINIDTFCMDANAIENVITNKTKAIVPVHIYGGVANMFKIKKIAELHNLKIVEDCAQAVGATFENQCVGTFGDAASFSFYPTKNLGAIGDGGAIVTKCKNVLKIATELRQYGWDENRICQRPGKCTRFDELQAAILRKKLMFLSKNNQKRCDIAKKYRAAIDEKKIVTQSIYDYRNTHVYHLFVVRSTDRYNLKNFLASEGIATAFHYNHPVHLQSIYLNRIKGSDNLPNTEKLYDEIITLPLYPELLDVEIAKICCSLLKWIKK